ncbi:MAG: hypothetical protein QNJ74_02190 [Trichodesmium sp. MO_231.B1]|nr:hypothetical protein [Trichodesmium sp. MO_231.B1]
MSGISIDHDLNASINLRNTVGQDPSMSVDEQPPTALVEAGSQH